MGLRLQPSFPCRLLVYQLLIGNFPPSTGWGKIETLNFAVDCSGVFAFFGAHNVWGLRVPNSKNLLNYAQLKRFMSAKKELRKLFAQPNYALAESRVMPDSRL